MSEKKASRIDIFKTVVLMVIVAVVVLVIWFLTSGSETRISTEYSYGDLGSLQCTSENPSDAFFVSKNVQKFTHEIKVMFTENYIKEISYRYEGTYNSESVAETAAAEMHADYNIYMGNNGINQEGLNPVFMTDKTKARVSLYAESSKLNGTVARLFFISGDEFGKLSDYSRDDLKKMYVSKGFSCQIHD